MDVADFDHNIFSSASAEADKALAVRFYMAPLRDDDASTREARPIYVDTEMVEIRVRGDRNNIVIRAAREDDKKRFRDAYRDFKDRRDKTESGTPLAEWPIMSASQVEELKYLGFYTVEHLAEANDAVLAKVPGLMTMKNRAKFFLEFSKGLSPLEGLQKNLEDEKSQRAMLETTIQSQAVSLEDLRKKYDALLEKLSATA